MIGGITDIFSFGFGIPSVCGMRIGDDPDHAFENALQDGQTVTSALTRCLTTAASSSSAFATMTRL